MERLLIWKDEQECSKVIEIIYWETIEYTTFSSTLKLIEYWGEVEKVMESFGTHFTIIEEVANLRENKIHDANLFNSVCGYNRNNLTTLDQCIKELRRSSIEEKDQYTKCVLAHRYKMSWEFLGWRKKKS